MKQSKHYISIKYILLLALLFGSGCMGPPKPDLLPEIQEEEPPSTEQLESDLKSENTRLRSLALLELAKRNERKFIPVAREILHSKKDPLSKAPAVLALGIWKDKVSLPEIIRLLHSKSEIDIETVLESISRMEDPSAGNQVTSLLGEESSTLRLLAVDTLVRINARQSGGAILAAAKANKDPEKAKTFAMALGKLNIKESEDYLIGLANSSEPGPTLAAAYLALGKIGSKKSVPLLAKALQGDFEKGRENSTIALVDIKDPRSISLMLPILENSNREIRYRAADVLIGVPDPSTPRHLMEILTKGLGISKGPASHVLGRTKYLPAREKMEKILFDESVPDREIVAQALGYLGDKKSIPVLAKVLKEDPGEAKYGAVWALGAIGSEEALPYIEEACASKDQKLSKIASESLGMIASPKSLALLDKKTEDFPDLAPITLSAIASISGTESRKILEKYALSNNINLHQVAVSQLAAKKDKESIPVLISLLEDEKVQRNRKLILSALKSITGLKYSSKNEWINWFRLKEKNKEK
ncbi:HEAT repeat domain-containing protein [Leptospira semungkisensis]|uniref:HEAT repeat domain-containing protein n=2 Tax=Leptospira semungkisensis TaxID=2484985 RepID=A0A4R9FQY1_9LEPT|nr:HEAT repeat domain-containing protein [Leptospira semungkisensis]TGK01128.1 HEAT repeat domain-containing protein [Leptospira semungkisensis]